MTTKTEYGPPIAVNGKRPEWLTGDVDCGLETGAGWVAFGFTPDCPAEDWVWSHDDGRPCILSIRLRSDHPYYQNAKYKARNGAIYIGDATDEGYALRQAIGICEAAGYTVTLPDPLAADREFLAGLMRAANGWLPHQTEIEAGKCTDKVSAAMDYLRQNKGRL